MSANSKLHAEAYFRFLEVSGQMENRIKEALKPLGLTHAQLNVLGILQKTDGGIGLIDIKHRLIVTSPDLSRLIDRLLAKGLVKRNTCGENRRKVDVTITQAGKKTYKKAHQAAFKAANNFFELNINQKEAKQLKVILNKIIF